MFRSHHRMAFSKLPHDCRRESPLARHHSSIVMGSNRSTVTTEHRLEAYAMLCYFTLSRRHSGCTAIAPGMALGPPVPRDERREALRRIQDFSSSSGRSSPSMVGISSETVG